MMAEHPAAKSTAECSVARADGAPGPDGSVDISEACQRASRRDYGGAQSEAGGSTNLAHPTIVRLLSDIRTILDAGAADRIASADLVRALAELPDTRWSTWSNNRPLTQHALARLLRCLQINPGSIRFGKKTVKGFHRASFESAWCCRSTVETGTSQQPAMSPTLDVPEAKSEQEDIAVMSPSSEEGSAIPSPALAASIDPLVAAVIASVGQGIKHRQAENLLRRWRRLAACDAVIQQLLVEVTELGTAFPVAYIDAILNQNGAP